MCVLKGVVCTCGHGSNLQVLRDFMQVSLQAFLTKLFVPTDNRSFWFPPEPGNTTHIYHHTQHTNNTRHATHAMPYNTRMHKTYNNRYGAPRGLLLRLWGLDGVGIVVSQFHPPRLPRDYVLLAAAPCRLALRCRDRPAATRRSFPSSNDNETQHQQQ